jgi:peptide/nickel transport system ATP-binding protein
MAPLIEIKRLKKYFQTPGGALHAVDDVSFAIEKGKTLGVVGESGCGKSTLGRTILGLTDATGGAIFFQGEDIRNVSGGKRKELRKNMQIIFQDPFSSLNPRMCIFDLIADPLRIYHVYANKSDRTKRVLGLMDTVGLARRLAYSYPHELDGGRRQRIGVARALALNPKFIVCDEPVSALDVSIQAQIINLLQDLQQEFSLTYIFITHDLSVVKHISDDILVMYLGCVVEKSPADNLFDDQLHPYTKGLLSAIPIPDINIPRKKVLLGGEITSPMNPKPACRFAGRCRYATDRCQEAQPQLEEVLPAHYVACHNVRSVNRLQPV